MGKILTPPTEIEIFQLPIMGESVEAPEFPYTIVRAESDQSYQDGQGYIRDDLQEYIQSQNGSVRISTVSPTTNDFREYVQVFTPVRPLNFIIICPMPTYSATGASQVGLTLSIDNAPQYINNASGSNNFQPTGIFIPPNGIFQKIELPFARYTFYVAPQKSGALTADFTFQYTAYFGYKRL